MKLSLLILPVVAHLAVAILAMSPFRAMAQKKPSADACAPFKLKSSYANENKKFEDFLKKSWTQSLKDAPEWGSYLGEADLADKWSDMSFEAIERYKKQDVCKQEILKSIRRARLSQDHQLNYDLFSEGVKLSIEGHRFDHHLLAQNQLNSVYNDIVETLMRMPSASVLDIENKLKRLERAPVLIGQVKALLRQGINKGITAPQAALAKVPAQFDPLLTSQVDDSVLMKAFQDLTQLPEKQALELKARARKLVEEKLYPSLKDFKKFLVEEYIPNARKTISLQDLPQGKEWYEWRVRRSTTTALTAEEIHQIGLDEVKRITDEMNKIRVKVGFKKDLKAFNKFLLKDSQFFYKKPDELLIGYRDIAKRADAELPKLFKILPRMPYGVRAIPEYMAKAAPMAYYNSGSLTAGQPGFFEANTYDLKARPKWGMEALTLHEAVPGHHLQIALAQELTGVPDFRRYGGYTAFSEGWGLYAESLGERMGFYTDPYSKYGQLSYEIWRAIRLVVDTGLHSKGWSREQALKYFRDNMAVSDLDSEVEVDRYIVWPAQALAYKLGQLKILELRQRAEKKLGEKFDIRDFHDFVLSGGGLPLNILDKRVDDWIRQKR